MLSKQDRQAIKIEAGLTRVKVVRTKQDVNGYPDRLLQATDHSDETWRGWWYKGDGAADIKWDIADADGWPEGLR